MYERFLEENVDKDSIYNFERRWKWFWCSFLFFVVIEFDCDVFKNI